MDSPELPNLTLDGVHLINLDTSRIKAQESSIVEYNRLRMLYRTELAKLSINRKRIKEEEIGQRARLRAESQKKLIIYFQWPK